MLCVQINGILGEQRMVEIQQNIEKKTCTGAAKDVAILFFLIYKDFTSCK